MTAALTSVELPPPFPDHTQLPESEPLTRTGAPTKVKPGKFWVYEQIIHIPFYGIYVIQEQKLEVYHLVGGRYQPLEANERGRYLIPPLGVELGLWRGSYQNQSQTWLRWWDGEGNLLLIGSERAERERERAERAETAWEEGKQRAQILAERLRTLGVEPESLF